jgi:hypothetical protein
MRRFLVKFLFLLLLLLTGQGLVGYFYPAPIPEPILHFQALLDQDVELLYFGDSTLWHPEGSQTTAAMLQELLPGRKVGELSHAAYGMDVYRSYINFMLRQGYRPALVIIPINMRAFSPEWDQRPSYQFTQEKRVLALGLPLARSFGRPLNRFGGYEPAITQDDFLRSPVYAGTTKIGKVQDFEDKDSIALLAEGGGEQFVYYQELPADGDYQRLLTYYYMAEVSPNHRKIGAMIDIAQRLQRVGVPVLFYVTPVNAELGDVYVGAAFRPQFTANVNVVREQLAAQGIELLDLSFALAAYFFTDTEHLRQPGKQYIAEQLALHIDPAAVAPRPTVTPLPMTPTVAATPSAPSAPPANPLLATTIARATQAASGVSNATPTAPPVAPPTPIANPLLATAVMRATEAAQR